MCFTAILSGAIPSTSHSNSLSLFYNPLCVDPHCASSITELSPARAISVRSFRREATSSNLRWIRRPSPSPSLPSISGTLRGLSTTLVKAVLKELQDSFAFVFKSVHFPNQVSVISSDSTRTDPIHDMSLPVEGVLLFLSVLRRRRSSKSISSMSNSIIPNQSVPRNWPARLTTPVPPPTRPQFQPSITSFCHPGSKAVQDSV